MRNFAAIFDWDGVVINSADLHEESWRLLAGENSLPFADDSFKKTFGQTNAHIIPNILKWTQDPEEAEKLSRRKECIFRSLACERGMRLIPGVKDFLYELRSRHIPCAIGSSTPLTNLKFALDNLDLWEFFTALVCAEDVKNGKPAPDVFLEAARELGARPENCVVFEDSVHGLQAAHAAGMKKVAVATTHEKDFLETQNADMIIRDFESLSAAELSALWE